MYNIYVTVVKVASMPQGQLPLERDRQLHTFLRVSLTYRKLTIISLLRETSASLILS